VRLHGIDPGDHLLDVPRDIGLPLALPVGGGTNPPDKDGVDQQVEGDEGEDDESQPEVQGDEDGKGEGDVEGVCDDLGEYSGRWGTAGSGRRRRGGT
jgi:hypothetical protein